MRLIILCCLSALLCAGCNSSNTEPTAPPKTTAPEDTAGAPEDTAGAPGDTPPGAAGGEVRAAAVSAGAELYDRVEGTSAGNACTSDADCKASGCSKEVCAAEELMTSCDVHEWPQGADAKCGCVNSQCIWYR